MDWLPEPESTSYFTVLPESAEPLAISTYIFYCHSTAFGSKGNVAITLLFTLQIKYFLLLVVNLLFQHCTGHPLVLQGENFQGAISTAFTAIQKCAPLHQPASKPENISPLNTREELPPTQCFLLMLSTSPVPLHNPWGNQTAVAMPGRHAVSFYVILEFALSLFLLFSIACCYEC